MRPNKFLGQNFLRSKFIVGEIVKTADIKPNDIVLEVGPGKGILTEELVKKARRVIAVEKDKRMIDFLKEKFANAKNLEIIQGDILKITRYALPVTCLAGRQAHYKIVANIPYYITSKFLRTFLQSDFQPSLMVLMVQKEVAERIVARDKKESILSISVKVYGQPKIIKKVSAKYFSPQPKVDSAILLIDKISKGFFKKNKIKEKKFFQLLKRSFSHKRKLLKNNLGVKDEILRKCNICPLARAENLSLENWKCLFLNIRYSY